MTKDIIIGVDEVGRGPVAGPVYVCAFRIDKKLIDKIIKDGPSRLSDSKKMSVKNREKWFVYLKKQKTEKMLDWSLLSFSASNVDKFGIAVCIKKLVDQTVKNLIKSDDEMVYLDGGLYLSDEKIKSITTIKGDENIPVISLASVVAKVLRDKEMDKYSKDYSEYSLEKNKGYGTKEHMKAIEKWGISDIHRKSYLRKFL